MNQRAAIVSSYLSVPGSPLQYRQPAFDVTERQKTPQWYTDNVRYYSTFYNLKKNNIDPLGTLTGNDPNNSGFNAPVIRGEADEMRLNYAYYFGRQPNVDFNYITVDSQGKSFQNPWIRGKHAAKLADFLKGPALKLLSSVKFTAQTLSKEAISEKGKLFDKALLKVEMADYMKEMEALGATFNPTNQDFSMMEELQDWMKDYKDEGEMLAANMATDLYVMGNLKYIYIDAWLDTVIGGLGAIYNYVDNGRTKKMTIPCFNVIWDSSNDSNFNERGQFVGFIEWMPTQLVMSRWRDKLSKTDIEIIKALARKEQGCDDFINYYNGSNLNFNWYRYEGNDLLVGVVTMFWIGPRDLRWKKIKDSDGEDDIEDLNDYTQDDLEAMYQQGQLSQKQIRSMQPQADIRGDYETDDVHKAVLIGNRILVEYGYNKNRVAEYQNAGNPELPIKLYVPNMKNGELRPTMSMLRDNQNEIDRLKWEIRMITGKAQGKIPVFRASKLVPPYNNPYVLADLAKDIGFLVVQDADGIDPEFDKKPLADYLDLSGNAGLIEQLIRLYQEEERTMEEILNLSKVALGQNQGYISQGAQQNTAAYSSMGTAYLFDGFMQFIANDTRYGCNVQKMLSAMNEDEEMVQFIAGTNGVTWSKITQERRFEDCLIFVKIADIVDEQARQRLLQLALAWSQNVEMGITPLDIIKLEKSTTYSEMCRILELSLKKGELKAKQREAYQNLQQKIMAEQQAQAQLGQEAMRQQGADKRTNEQVQGKLAGDLLKHHASIAGKNKPAPASSKVA